MCKELHIMPEYVPLPLLRMVIDQHGFSEFIDSLLFSFSSFPAALAFDLWRGFYPPLDLDPPAGSFLHETFLA